MEDSEKITSEKTYRTKEEIDRDYSDLAMKVGHAKFQKLFLKKRMDEYENEISILLSKMSEYSDEAVRLIEKR
jgi:hypothetical protein